MFKIRIHIYDIKEYGIEKYNSSVRVNFKIRKNNEKSAEKKLKAIFGNLEEKGVRINLKEEVFNRPKLM